MQIPKWNDLNAKTKRLIYVGSIVGAVLTVMAIAMPEGKTYKVEQEETIEHLLTNKDTKSLTLQSMSANIDSLKTSNAKFQRVIDNLTAEIKELQRENGPTRMMQREIAELKSSLTANERKSLAIIERIDDISESNVDITEEIIDEVTRQIKLDGGISGPSNGAIPIAPAMQVVNEGGNGVPQRRGNGRNPVEQVPQKVIKPQESTLQIYDNAEEFFKTSKTPKQSSGSGDVRGSKSGDKSKKPAKISIRSISSDDPETSTVAQKAKEIKKKREENEREESQEDSNIIIPAGSIIEAVIIAGMDAPTNQGAKRSPFPSLMRIKKDAILPNRRLADIKECFLIASGYGDMGSERAYMRGETLSCITADNKVIESRFDSFSVGEDGKTGIRGRLVTKSGALIGNAMLAGFGEGLASAFDVSVVPTISNESGGTVDFQRVLTEEALQKGAVGGVQNALGKIADYYLEMAENITPVIEIDAGRVVSFITTKGISLRTK